MTRSARAAALRTTALATSLALAVGLSAFAVEAAAKPRFHCRSRGRSRATSCPIRPRKAPCPRQAPPRPARDADAAAGACPGAGDPPARCPRSGAPADDAGGGRGDDRRLRRPMPMRWKTSSNSCARETRRRDPGGSRDLGSGRQKTRGMDHPAQRRQRRVGGALSRLHISQSELAVADLPAPPRRSGAVGRPSRRRDRMGLVRKRIAAIGQRQILAGKGDDRARRPQQCGAPGARRLAQRFDVRGYREHRARPVRRADHAGRSQGADGFAALRQRTGCGDARRQAARRQPGSAGERAQRRLSQGVQHQGAARRGAARTARRSRLHVQQDPAASPRGEIRRGSPADAERAEGSGPAVQSRRMVDRAAAAVAQDARRRANTAPPI